MLSAIGTGTIIFLSVSLNTVIAQSGDVVRNDDTPRHVLTVPERSQGLLNNLNTRSVRQFKQAYPEATGERWTTGAEGSRVVFEKDGVHYIIDYARNGGWRDTFRVLSEKQMPADLRRLIKSNFIDESILTVTELRTAHDLAYFVKLDDANSSRLVRVMNNDMEVIEEFEK